MSTARSSSLSVGGLGKFAISSSYKPVGILARWRLSVKLGRGFVALRGAQGKLGDHRTDFAGDAPHGVLRVRAPTTPSEGRCAARLAEGILLRRGPRDLQARAGH